ncbi:hypothetical protein WG68_04505 [Arsukibacterium ikkense]|uniref:TIGR00725 family protein n=1 Tax=Arsukibacterium ikkense TaxID=336831 RepID=A0A0M2V819_9GAMM|nr:TIGR00725 family protein [Arsukibacterium ikkense]KKO46569.1 hypothetical protein WG68_04505 [Arsukibacterium ikkense]
MTNNNNKLFRSKQVSLVGNARILDPVIRELSSELGMLIAKNGYSLVCGGLGGVMEAACRGFKQCAETSGVTVGILPSFDAAQANEYIDIVIPTGLDVGRNQLVVASGFATIVIGGGAGTLSEVALASQINKPVILLKGSGGWADKITDDYLDQRENARVYHAHSVSEVITLLKVLETHTDKSGVIGSGHNR